MAMNLEELSNVVKRNPGWCPGCGHPVFQRIIMECIEELGLQSKCISIPGIGCTGLTHEMVENDRYWLVPHGRAGAVATGVKRVNPDVLVYTWQGDGDAMNIGLSETLNAAYRNENICMFVSVNNFFSMTGGQMSWSTLPGQKTSSSPLGRDCELTGKPLRLANLIADEFDVAYAARGKITSPKSIIQLKSFVMDAMKAQLNGEGFSIVEALSPCPTSWEMSPQESKANIDETIEKFFPVGVFKERSKK